MTEPVRRLPERGVLCRTYRAVYFAQDVYNVVIKKE